jgi:type I restriction enzyme S subunit
MQLKNNDLQKFEELPTGWKLTTLGQVLPISYGKGLTKASRESGTYPVFGSSGQVGQHSKALTAKPSLIIGRKGSVGEVYHSNAPCWPIDTVYFAEESEGGELKYFEYLLRGLNLAKLDKSTAVPGLSRDDYNAVEVAVAPLDQQHRIVAEIEKQFSRLDEAVATLKRVKTNLKRYKAAVLKAAVEGKLTEEWRKQHPDLEPASALHKRVLAERRVKRMGKRKYRKPTGPDMSPLSSLPNRWGWATLPQLGELNRGKSKHRPRNDPRLFGGPYPFIQTGDVKNSGGFVRSHSQTYSEAGLAQSYLWPEGTLCITIAANIAETGILTYPACFPDSVVGFAFDGDPVTVHFLGLFFRTAKDQIARFAPATAQKNINLDILSEVAVPLPPLEEQRQIVAEVERHLSVIAKLEAVVEGTLDRTQGLRHIILVQAFAGHLALKNGFAERGLEADAPIAVERRNIFRRKLPAPLS